jgi:hypothetical protein
MDLEVAVKLWADNSERMAKGIEALKPRECKPIHKPVFGVATAVAAGTPLIVDVTDQPAPGNIWFIHRIGVFGNDGHTQLWSDQAANTNITAGAGARTLNGGQALAGFDITFTTAPTAAGTITVSGVNNFANGNSSLTFNVPSGQTAPMSFRFNPPLVANPIGNSITVTFSATGAVGNMEVYGVTPPSAAPQGDVEVYAGFPPDEFGSAVFPPLSDLILTSQTIPVVEKYGRRTQNVHANEHIYAVCYGIQPGQQIILSAYISEWPVEAEESMVI